ncbi:MAG TPA: exodeoxyribonuclease III [Polyangiaceae bacterium]|nr:exodeoxyribonuclease III [Polyangiaceae bacterium]
MRIISYNVNSIRERLRAVRRIVRKYEPDVLCLQETKVVDDLFPRRELLELGFADVVVAGQKGYHGVAIASRPRIDRSWSHAIGGNPEKRHLAIEVHGVEIHDVYVPAGGPLPDPDRNPAFARKLAFLTALGRWTERWPDRQSKPRILVGDLNVAPLEHDVWDHRKMRRTITHTEREVALLETVRSALPWVDVGRVFVPPEEKLFTWWSYRAPNWRQVDKGRRLDHAWVSEALRDQLEGYFVAKEVRGWKKPSDHAPVVFDVKV